MERRLPKNVRQIGNVSDNPKIYVEDYVDTFLIQLCEQTKDEPQGAFLIGDVQSEDEQTYIFIYGAIRMHSLKKTEHGPVIDEEVWKKAYEDCKQYFEDGEMIGWFSTVSAGKLDLTPDIKKLHKKSFPKKNTVLILEEPSEREESFYANKFNDLMHIAGHYVYYEKNPCMQNYMISCRKKNGVSPSETVEDRVAKDFRSLVRTREEAKEQKKISKFLYVTSGILVLIVIALGITTMNNFDKMKSVESMVKSMNNTDKITSVAETVQKEVDSGTSVEDEEKDSISTKEKKENEEKKSSSDTNNEEANSTDINNEEASKTGTNNTEANNTDTSGTGTSSVGTNHVDAQGDTQENESNGSNGVYVVEEGDTLAIISQKCYGDVSHIDSICRMNGLNDSNLIYVGQKLLLP